MKRIGGKQTFLIILTKSERYYGSLEYIRKKRNDTEEYV